MDEATWLECPAPDPMLTFLNGRASERRYRLFACACCRHVWDLMSEDEGRLAVKAAERYAHGNATAAEMVAAGNRSNLWPPWAATRVGDFDPAWVAQEAATVAQDSGREPGAVRGAQSALLRCIFGNPFRPVAVDPGWRTADVLRLVEAINADRTFDQLPVLADLLEEAGATDAQLLGHLRGPGPHALGCHALDAVLGKE